MKNERSKKHRVFQLLRVAIQAAFFFLFLYLMAVTHYPGDDYIGPVERFFHFDPLLGLTTFIATRVFFASFLLAGITLLVTLILGRVACGWACPLGTLHQFFSWVFKKARFLKPKNDGKAGLAWKYVVLVFVLAGSLFTLNLVGYLDPLSFLYRSFTLAVFPFLAFGADAVLDVLYGTGMTTAGRSLGQFVENMMFNTIFLQGLFIGLLLTGAVMLNAWKERFWCRYLCPLGALLGLFSRWNIFKLRIDEDKCIKCGLCNLHCETQATPFPNAEWKSSECVYCQTCAAICPTAAISFPLKPAPAKMTGIDLSRRKLVLTTFLGFAAAPLFRITPARKRASEKLIRPPGSLPEEDFLRTCVKCGACMKVCPTNGLQPTLSEAGPEGIWTPMLVPKIGYCEYYCSLCTQVCPTGAIRELTVEEKVDVKIGTSWVDKSRCIPYVFGKPCIVCEEHCPTSPKAIKLVEVEAKLPDGSIVTQMGPVIDLDLCIGCGVCENKCPVMDKPAIFVTSVGEERSSKNQLLLELF
ncbi:MAG: 4Fe-4S binding protein [Acidobacteriota bacterium]|nr:4Fe-4S binding protein [Acidobacteriota bacterium]